MSADRLGVLLGDGIGPEIVPASVRVVDAALAAAGADPVAWEELPLGASAIETHGSAIPAATIDALDDLDGWLLGPHDSAAYPEPFRSQLNPSGTLRKHFDLYANIRPARAFEGGRAIARTAFELARRRRGKVTIVHKANVLQMSSGLFKRVCLEVAEG